MPLGREARDLGFLRRQVAKRVDPPSASVLSRRLELDARALRERFHGEVSEELVRRPELGARLGGADVHQTFSIP
jgi:hypothetical protein